MSWIKNKVSWGRFFKIYREREHHTPLPLRAESNNPLEIYYTWHKILYLPSYKNRIMPVRDEGYQEYEQAVDTTGKTILGFLS